MRNLLSLRCSIGLLVVVILAQFSSLAQVNVTTYHNDNARTGQNTQETVLSPANVKPSTFGQLFWVPLDGQVYAQPLVLNNVNIGGVPRSVVYAATENDSIYAIDANNGQVYWHASLGTAVPSSEIGGNCTLITPTYGITSTPVIDPIVGTLYVVAQTTLSGVPAYQLHAINVSTGADNFTPVTISASIDGITFNSANQHIRTALLLDNNYIIFGSGAQCDHPSWYGWVMAYNSANLSQRNVFLTNPPPDNQAGVWMSGNGVAADSAHNLYFTTGNSDSGLNDSIVKLPPPPPPGSTWSSLDYFSPSISYLRPDDQSHDMDVGSGGVLLLPSTNLLVQMGKPGDIYLVDTVTGHMGEYCGAPGCTDNIVQEIVNESIGLWGSPAYWNGNVYFGSAREDDYLGGAAADSMKEYSFDPNGGGSLSKYPTFVTPESFSWPAPTPSVSSNGTSNGILWAIENNGGLAVLHAFDATKLTTEFYNSNNPQDSGTAAIKFSVPTVANGKVYVGGNENNGSSGGLTVFGLTSAGPGCSPTFACFHPGGQRGQVMAQITVSCTNFPNWISTTAQGCAPTMNGYQCGSSNGPAGVLSSSTAIAVGVGGGISGPPSICNYTYMIGTAQLKKTIEIF